MKVHICGWYGCKELLRFMFVIVEIGLLYEEHVFGVYSFHR